LTVTTRGPGEGCRWGRPIIYKMNQILQSEKQESRILHTRKRRKADWIGHILRGNCFLKDVTEGKLEGRIGSDEKTRKEM